MISALDPAAVARIDQLTREFLEAKPFRHVVIEPFLDLGFRPDLMMQFPPFDREKALNELGELGGKAVFSKFSRLGPA